MSSKCILFPPRFDTNKIKLSSGSTGITDETTSSFFKLIFLTPAAVLPTTGTSSILNLIA